MVHRVNPKWHVPMEIRTWAFQMFWNLRLCEGSLCFMKHYYLMTLVPWPSFHLL